MIDWILRTLGRGDRLARLSLGADRRMFAQAFADSEIIFLVIHADLAVEPSELDGDELLSSIEQAAQRTAETEDVHPFTYSAKGRTLLPLFSDQKLATEFVKSYVQEINRVVPVGLLSTQARYLLPGIAENGDTILNPRTRFQVLLSPEDVRLLLEFS